MSPEPADPGPEPGPAADPGTVPGADPATDAALLARYVERRDAGAFAELVRRFGPLVWGVCRRRTAGSGGGHQTAEDAFQAAFLIFALKARSIRDPAALPGWLHRTAHRAASRAARRDEPHGSLDALPETAEPIADAADAFAALARREALAAFDEEVLKLPAAEREALVLCHLHGLTRGEAAGRLSVTGAAVKGRLARGRSRLRTRLARRGFALPLAAPLLLSDPVPAAAADAVCRLADPLSLSAGGSPAVSFLPDWSEKGLSAMNFLKSRPAAVLLTAAACVALLALFQPAPPIAAGGGGDPGQLDGRLPDPAPPAFPNPGAVRLAGFDAVQPPHVGGGEDEQPGGGESAGPNGTWERQTALGLARMTLKDGRLSLDLDLTADEAPLRIAVEAEYAVLNDGTLAGVIHSFDAGLAGGLGQVPGAALELAAYSALMVDQAFALRLYRSGETFVVKDVSVGVARELLRDSSEETAGLAAMAGWLLPGRWDPAGQRRAAGRY